jgi:hypothetical protein
MMTLVYEEMAIFSDPVIHNAFAHQALHERYVQHASRFLSAAPDLPDGFGAAQKCG